MRADLKVYLTMTEGIHPLNRARRDGLWARGRRVQAVVQDTSRSYGPRAGGPQTEGNAANEQRDCRFHGTLSVGVCCWCVNRKVDSILWTQGRRQAVDMNLRISHVVHDAHRTKLYSVICEHDISQHTLCVT